jgi:hypothetical protein
MANQLRRQSNQRARQEIRQKDLFREFIERHGKQMFVEAMPAEDFYPFWHTDRGDRLVRPRLNGWLRRGWLVATVSELFGDCQQRLHLEITDEGQDAVEAAWDV